MCSFFFFALQFRRNSFYLKTHLFLRPPKAITLFARRHHPVLTDIHPSRYFPSLDFRAISLLRGIAAKSRRGEDARGKKAREGSRGTSPASPFYPREERREMSHMRGRRDAGSEIRSASLFIFSSPPSSPPPLPPIQNLLPICPPSHRRAVRNLLSNKSNF